MRSSGAACLERIEEREPQVEAWQYLNSDQVIEAARAFDRAGAHGPLAGVPFGVKDIIDTADMPTEYGSPIYRGHRPKGDAACVALTRKAGGILLGKTVTTEFANRFPGKTRNPFDPARTPGGSSSGSAAAVGDRMLVLAIGTQTTGPTVWSDYDALLTAPQAVKRRSALTPLATPRSARSGQRCTCRQ